VEKRGLPLTLAPALKVNGRPLHFKLLVHTCQIGKISAMIEKSLSGCFSRTLSVV
jgi:hypothetical protein